MRAALIPLLFPLATAAQTLTPTLLTPLDPILNETSGLLNVSGEVWTNLDSGNGNVLYRIDPTTGAVMREVVLGNANNVDWEEVTTDGTWVYMGDFGNNGGDRTNLRVYRFPLDTLLNLGSDTVLVDTIRFSYADQFDFTPAYEANNWDCEAFIALSDSLFLFTKNWIDGRTFLYVLPATPGDHLAVRIDSLDAQGLVTAATLDAASGDLALLGYTNGFFVPFVWALTDYSGHHFFNGIAERHALTIPFVQTEGVVWSGAGSLLISNEQSPFSAARLWELELPMTVGTVVGAPTTVRLFPVPATSYAIVSGASAKSRLRIMDIRGAVVRDTQLAADGLIPLNAMPNGHYFLEVTSAPFLHRMPLIIAR